MKDTNEIIKICLNIENYIPPNRIDGVYIGNVKKLVTFVDKIMREGFYIYIVGEITNLSEFREIINIENKKYLVFVSKKLKENFYSFISENLIERFYLIDNNKNVILLIDDFPEDITIGIDYVV